LFIGKRTLSGYRVVFVLEAGESERRRRRRIYLQSIGD